MKSLEPSTSQDQSAYAHRARTSVVWAGRVRWVLWLGLLVGPLARAEPPRVLRLATVMPAGTAWARELKAFERDVETQTVGEVRIKWYLNGVAGEEREVFDRIGRHQLDGQGASVSCGQLAPSFKVTRLPGLFESRAEALYVLAKLRPILNAEYLRAGFVNLADVLLGSTMLFTRAPISTFEEMKRVRFWRWSYDEVANRVLREMGIQFLPLPLGEAGKAYDERRLDGFFSFPNAALAFQLSARARYLTRLRVDYFFGCLPVATRSFDLLTFQQQQIVRGAASKMAARLDEVTSEQDTLLLDGLFARQGVIATAPNAEFRNEFRSAARDARDRLGDQPVPHRLITQVQSLLADYRAEHTFEPRDL